MIPLLNDRRAIAESEMILRKATQIALATCLALLVAAVAVPNPQKKEYKDRAEYDIISKVYGEADAANKLALLDEWTEKYPETDYHLERSRFYLDSYQKVGKTAEAVTAAKELLGKVPGDFAANYAITLFSPYLGKADPAFVQEATEAASGVLEGIPTQFGTKPDTVPQEVWDSARTQAEAAAHMTVGWGRMQQKNNEAAEESFRKVLETDPSRGQASYWLGQVVLAQNDAAKYDVAFAAFARAAVYEGPNAMAAEGRDQVKEYVQNLIRKNYGEESLELYWPKFEEMAKAGPLPTERLELKTDAQRKFDAEQKSRKENPLLWTYRDLKTTLSGAQGDATWARLNGALTPKMRLYVVSSNPPERPATINFTSEPDSGIELVLNLANRMRTGVRAGTMLTIEGVAVGLRKDPFRLTLNEGKATR